MSCPPLYQGIHGRFEIPQADTVIIQQFLRFGAHQRTDLQMLLDAVEPDDVVLDLGAHVGTYTVPLAQRAAEVICVEASIQRFGVLERNISHNGLTNVLPLNDLVSARSARMTMRQTRRIEIDHVDPLWEKSEDGRLTRPIGQIAELTSKPISVIKSDVEGMDFEVIQALFSSGAISRPFICAECLLNSKDSAAFERLFSTLGYNLFVNAAPRNSSIYEYTPLLMPNIERTTLSGIYDIFAVPAESAHVDRWISQVRTPDGVRLLQAFVANAQGRHNKVVDILSPRSIEKPGYFFLLGNSTLKKRAPRQALEYIEAGLGLLPPLSEAFCQASACARMADMASKAQNYAELAIAANPTDAIAHLQFALALKSAGRGVDAIKSLDRARDLDPANQSVKAQIQAFSAQPSAT